MDNIRHTNIQIWNLFFYFLVWILLKKVCAEEICSFSTFSPTCQESQVINITKATYGRMRIGNCVQQDRGSLGCQMDVLSYFDRNCSGRQSCEVAIPVGPLSQELNCLEELSAYLEVEYDCVEVYMPTSRHCLSGHEIQTTPHHPLSLSSLVSKKSLCGFHDTPWTLLTLKGQRIQLTLTDFSWTIQPGQVTDNSDCSKIYGYVMDTNANDVINICGGLQKERVLYVSQGHAVQIVIESNQLKDHYFLIKYEVLGCPNFINPPGTWLQKGNDTITIGCITNSVTWRLRCVQNGWLGHVGNCSADYDGETHRQAESNEDSGWSFNDNHVLAFTIGCVTVVTCCVTVLAGYYCVKKYELRSQQREPVVTPRLLYDDGTLVSTHSSVFYRPTYTTNNTLNKHSLLLNQPNPPHSSNMRPPLVPERTTSLTRPPKKSSSTQNIMSPYNNNNSKMFNENTYFTDSMRIQNNPLFNHPSGNASNAGNTEAQYFVLETPRESVTDEREQLYQSIHLRSTSSSVSD